MKFQAVRQFRTCLRLKMLSLDFFGDSPYKTYALDEVVGLCGLFPQMKPDRRGVGKAMSSKACHVKMFSNACIES